MMTTGRFNSRRITLAHITAATAGVLIGIFQLCDHIGLRINTSPSLPMGLYVATKDLRAELVEFCPPGPFAALAVQRGYRQAGSCPDGAAPLLKPVVADVGDSVEVSDAGISVNGRLLAQTAPLTRDTRGRLLSPWAAGVSMVAPGTIWVASTYNPRSFDSRYFGPIPIGSIRNRVRPFLTAR